MKQLLKKQLEAAGVAAAPAAEETPAEEAQAYANATREQALAIAVRMVRVMMPFYLFQGLFQVYSGVLRSFGHSRAVMVLSLVGMIVVRQAYLAIALAIDHSIEHVFLCFPVGWIAAAGLMMGYYWIKIKRNYPAVDYPQGEEA